MIFKKQLNKKVQTYFKFLYEIWCFFFNFFDETKFQIDFNDQILFFNKL